MIKRYLGVLFVCLCAFPVIAQERGTYHILSVTGNITDRKTNKALLIGDKVNLQTELQFGDLSDKAVLLSPSKVKYRLEMPESSLTGQQLVVTSQKALQTVRSKSIQLQGTRGATVKMATEGVSVQALKAYFGADTFSIIGNTFKLPVASKDLANYKLVVRYEHPTGVNNIKTSDFTLSKSALGVDDRFSEIKECFILLDDGKTVQPVTQICLFFVDEDRLLKEFAALLTALNIKKDNTPKTQILLKQYCLDIYGNIDQTSLNNVTNRFFE
ncbi:MAG: hypothetical protein LBU62_07745 [Bacteroidales bacterium]|jgi:hypothetical protein|nr:hypothetical protein [Bacteroidales bacterium]